VALWVKKVGRGRSCNLQISDRGDCVCSKFQFCHLPQISPKWAIFSHSLFYFWKKILTSTADELFGGTNIDDLERPRTPKIWVLSDFFALLGCGAHLKENFPTCKNLGWGSTCSPLLPSMPLRHCVCVRCSFCAALSLSLS